jgi:hypothetical protein
MRRPLLLASLLVGRLSFAQDGTAPAEPAPAEPAPVSTEPTPKASETAIDATKDLDIEDRKSALDEQEKKLETHVFFETEWHEFDNLDLRPLDESSDQAILDSDDRNGFAFTGFFLELGYQVDVQTRVVTALSYRGLWGNDQIGNVNRVRRLLLLHRPLRRVGAGRSGSTSPVPSGSAASGSRSAAWAAPASTSWATSSTSSGSTSRWARSARSISSRSTWWACSPRTTTSTSSASSARPRPDLRLPRRPHDPPHGGWWCINPDHPARPRRARLRLLHPPRRARLGLRHQLQRPPGQLRRQRLGVQLRPARQPTPSPTARHPVRLLRRSASASTARSCVTYDVDTFGLSWSAGATLRKEKQGKAGWGVDAELRYFEAQGPAYDADGLQYSHGYVGMKARQVGGLVANRFLGWHPTAYVGSWGVEDTPQETDRKSGMRVISLDGSVAFPGPVSVSAGYWFMQDTGLSLVNQARVDDIEPPYGYSREEFRAQARLGKLLGHEVDLGVGIRLSKHLDLNFQGGVMLPGAYYQQVIARVAGTALGSNDAQPAWDASGGVRLNF